MNLLPSAPTAVVPVPAAVAVSSASAPVTAAAAAALLLVPGWLLARSWGARGVTAVGSAPSLTLGVLGTATLLAQRTGQRWEPAALLTGWPMLLLASACAVGLALRRLPLPVTITSRDTRGTDTLDRDRLPRRERLLLLAAITLAGGLTAIPTALGTGSWDNPAQASDAVFHLSATAYVRETGTASFLGGLAPMYGGTAVYYPTGWHAVAALLPGNVITGANLLVVVLAALVWPLGVAALLREVLPGAGSVLAVGTALSGSVVSPLLLLTSVWPYGMSVVMLPGALALLVRAVRSGKVGARERTAAWILALGACLGVLIAHGAAVFNLAVLGLPVVVAAGVPAWRSVWRRGVGARVAIAASGALLLLLLAGGAWTMRRPLAAVFNYPRAAGNIWETLFAVVTDHPLLATFTPWIPGNALVFALAVWGAAAWRRDTSVRAWAVGTGISLLLLLLASGPAWPLRALAGPWYTQRARIMPLLTLGVLVLAAFGIQQAQRRWGAAKGAPASAVGRGLTLMRQHVPATLLVISLLAAPGWRWGLRAELLEAIHDPERISYGAMLSAGELDFIRRIGGALPDDAVVLGDPSNGSAYLWSVTGTKVLYPSRPRPSTAELRWLGENADQIETDPRVCEILNRYGVEYYYSDDAEPDGLTGGVRKPLWGEALARVPRSALEEVDSQGSATLWRITACDAE
ncbi:DUF6541 family protein [Actinomyces sp. 565]|uniref:DUF6541 family protein n=1 Tax=Actinomyces sp. 565 TaxID=2057794 RepID=UPI001939A38A|nr:DUF6541 family protein [Actinomyces sp. 565]